MSKAVESLTPDQRNVFDSLTEQLQGVAPSDQLAIVGALSDHTELTILAQRPFQLEPAPAFPPTE
jgi:hypothetical protein